MADFMRFKYENPKLKQYEIANQMGYSTSTLQRYRNDIKMLNFIEFHQITLINAQKRLQIQVLITIHIVTLTLRDLK